MNIMLWGEMMMWTYALGVGLILLGFILDATGHYGLGIDYFLMAIGALIILVNALYWSHWLVVGILIVAIVGLYLFLKIMTVG